MRSFILRPV